MRRHGFVEKDVEPAQIYSEIKVLVVSEGFAITSEEVRQDYWYLHAKKSGIMKIVLGQVRDLDVVVAGSKGRFEVQLHAGVWGRDLAVPAIESVATFGVVGIEERRSARDLEERLWEQIVNKIDPSLLVCEYDGLLFKTYEDLQNHLKIHKKADIDAESAWANAMTLTGGGLWV